MRFDRDPLTRLLARGWPSYVLVTLLQMKVLWLIWRFRDLTTGDTSSYFNIAYLWYERLGVKIAWSPLYTAFYGSVFALTRDAYLATTLHRVIIVVAATLGVLALMRRLLPPGLALAIAAWWAIMPINFNTLYEVHLFSLLPVLLAWLVAARFDSPAGRGAVLAILLAASVLVRNELVVASVLFAAACVVLEALDLRRIPGGRAAGAGRKLVAYVAPLCVALAICAFFYSRSIVRGPELQRAAQRKHGLNMCQVYAFGYAQRHPTWTASPWTECQDLAEATFGKAMPSLAEMIAANPRAVLEHFLWNLSLTPAGLQLGLFNVTWGGATPDYVPVEFPYRVMAVIFSLTAGVVVIAGIVTARRDWRFRWARWFGERRGVWLAMLAVACVSVPVVLTQRPRPSYLFAVTVILMAVIGSAVHVLTCRWALWRDRAAVTACLLALILAPPYFVTAKSERPLDDAYQVLRPLAATLANTKGKVVLGDYAYELPRYVQLKGVATVESYSALQPRTPSQSVADFFDEQDIDAVFVQPRILTELRQMPGAGALLSHPESLGWRAVTTTRRKRTWILLYRTRFQTAFRP